MDIPEEVQNKDERVFNFKKEGSFLRIRDLDHGSFGGIILVEPIKKNSSSPKYYVVKSIKKLKGMNPRAINFLELKELTIMKEIKKNPEEHLAQMIDYSLNRQTGIVNILMNYYGSNLEKLIFENYLLNFNIFNEPFLKDLSKQIVQGVNHLHKNLIMHRDIKPSNILFDPANNLIKITDFGLSEKVELFQKPYVLAGTFSYEAPEILLGFQHYSTSIDVWSIGCVLVEMMTGERLFKGNNPIDVLKKIIEIFGSLNHEKLPFLKSFANYEIFSRELPSAEGIGIKNYLMNNKNNKNINFSGFNDFCSLIEKLLCINPKKRITLDEALLENWFMN